MSNLETGVFREALILIFLSLSLVLIPSTSFINSGFFSISSSGIVGSNWLRTNGKWIVDSQKNIVILRGANLIDWKAAHTEEDFGKMASWGFNTVRLPIAWDRIEPQPGSYDFSYLGNIDNDIEWARKYGIYIVLDMHQWRWSPHFTLSGAEGCGMPVWLVSNYTDSSAGINRAITDFWLGKAANGSEATATNPSMQDRYIDIWKLVADRYKDEPTVAIYELFNEPYHSDVIVPQQMPNYLYPFYDRLIKAIRALDSKHIIAYQATGGWDSGRAQKMDYDNIAYTFHYYYSHALEPYDGNATALRDGFMYRYSPPHLWQSNPSNWNMPIYLGEFGTDSYSGNPNASKYVVDYRNILDNEVQIGWMWWVYTKSEGYGKALLYANGTERTELTTYLRVTA